MYRYEKAISKSIICEHNVFPSNANPKCTLSDKKIYP